LLQIVLPLLEAGNIVDHSENQLLFLDLDGAEGDEAVECCLVGLQELPFEAFVLRLKGVVQPGLGHVGGWGVVGLAFWGKIINRLSFQGLGGLFAEQLGGGKVGRLDLPALWIDLEEGIG